MVRISNLRLIRILEDNSRTPYVKIARAFGVSETAVRKRVAKLEREGIIKRYTIEADLKKLGYNIRALIGIDTRPDLLIPAIDKLKTKKSVAALHTSSGDHMLMVEGWFENHNSLANFVKSIKGIEGVTKVCPAIILERIK